MDGRGVRTTGGGGSVVGAGGVWPRLKLIGGDREILNMVGCTVNEGNLAWLDSSKMKNAWKWTSTYEALVVRKSMYIIKMQSRMSGDLHTG